MATNDLRPTQDTEESAKVRNAVRQLWSLYGEMKRMVSYAMQVGEVTLVDGVLTVGNPETLAQVFGYQTDTAKSHRVS